MRGKTTKLIKAVSELKSEDYSKEPELNEIYNRLTKARQEFAEIFEKNIIKIDKGNIKIFGKDYKNENVKEEIGVVLDNTFFPELLTPKDINNSMKSIYKNWDSDLYFSYLKEFDLPENKTIKSLSKGMRKKLEIATSLAHKPKLLILDEPTSGLDPVIRSEVLDIFLKFIEDDEHSILLSTHITSDLEHIADKIVFIDEGKIVLEKSRDEIMDDYAILKCDIDYFSKIDKEDILRLRKTKYSYEILVNEKQKMSKKYQDCVLDKISIEDLMLLMIKGERI